MQAGQHIPLKKLPSAVFFYGRYPIVLKQITFVQSNTAQAYLINCLHMQATCFGLHFRPSDGTSTQEHTRAHVVIQLVAARRHKPEGRGFDPRCCHFIILPAALWPWGDSVSNWNEYQEYFLWGKGGRCLGLATLPTSCADCFENWEPETHGTIRVWTGLYSDCLSHCLSNMDMNTWKWVKTGDVCRYTTSHRIFFSFYIFLSYGCRSTSATASTRVIPKSTSDWLVKINALS
jgi:hypothetical protein